MFSVFKINSIHKLVRPSQYQRFFANTQIYEDFDYSKFFKSDGDKMKLPGNLSSNMQWIMKSMEDFVVSQIISIPEGNRKHNHVLDVACGTGEYCQRMSNLGFGEIKGTILSEVNRSEKLHKIHVHVQRY